jgi:hypothetical protein
VSRNISSGSSGVLKIYSPTHEWMTMAREKHAIFSKLRDPLISVAFDPLI